MTIRGDIKGTSKKKLVPELRFPEFEKDGEWEEMTLGENFERISEKNTNNNQNVLTISAQYGLVSQNDYFNKNVAAANIKNYYFIHKGDFAYNKSRSQGYPFGVIKPLRRYESGVVSTLYICFRAKTNCCIDFYEQYFDTVLINNEISKIAQEGARNHGLLNISVDDFFNKIKILVPHSSEREKIAECLSSIDEEISALKEKVVQLKAHKKGLMQKLFPDAEKFLPEIRFPEFNKDWEWEEKKLGDCLLQSPDYGLNAPAVPYSSKLPTYLRITDISDDGKFIKEGKVSVKVILTDENSLHDGDIVLARTGASVGKSYKYRKEDGLLIFAGFLIRIKPNAIQYDSEFIFQYLHTDIYKKWVSITSVRSGQPGINSNEYSLLPIPFPFLEEQQKIAECLSSIDELISLYESKVSLLEQHKKGLMQRLFPKL